MSLAHAVYIPLVLAVGVYVGWMLGGRSVKQAWDREERRRRREEEDGLA